MKWIYGKQDFKTLERGEENCYLLTNGLGGFSSMNMLGGVSRNDHAFFMACINPPNHRYNLIHRLREELELEGEKLHISSQEFQGKEAEKGYEYLSSFVYEDTPLWRFHVKGVEIVKEMAMEQDTNRIALQYRIHNRSKRDGIFSVTPFFQFVPKTQDLDPLQEIHFCPKENKIESSGMKLFFRTNGEILKIPKERETLFYSYDVCDGRRACGHAKANHKISIMISAGSKATLEIVYEMEKSSKNANTIIQEAKAYRKVLEKCAGFNSPIAQQLAKSANQFIAKRASTNGSTILAGFPFFEDWGRDTMIALPGICISTKQYEKAKEILRTFAAHEKDGLMPNLFPEGEQEPMYNTVDAALLFINGVYLYYNAAKDVAFVQEVYPVMKHIIENYRSGTHFGIHMDTDGLIQAGEGLAQVTWMDVRIGEILPTPRHGKPVEINAYWYNALKIMEILAELVDESKESYAKLAEMVKGNFQKQFWMEEKGCLKDLVSGTTSDMQIRCNQIWAVSMPFTMLVEEQEKKVVETVFEKLYTPYGLRTLEEDDREFHGIYEGPVEKRDMAYHQGTVWTFPLGAYYLAYLKVHHYSREAVEIVKEQLEVMESAMREGCIGQLPEIYDGKNPTSSKGCFAQAWSTGEILRVYEALENKKV